MTFSDSTYSSSSEKIKTVEFPFGNFYLAEKYVVSEVNADTHIDWDKSTAVFDIIEEYYPKGHKIGFISNRINAYSSDPNYWSRLNSKYDCIAAFAIVSYSDLGYQNATLEKLFADRSLKRCSSLQEAIEWVLKLKELN
jgi:hypothetical protein